MPLSLTAHAHDGVTVRTTTSFEAPLLDLRTPLNAEVYHEFLDEKLDRLAALVDATRAKVAAIPNDEVLTGIERRVAKVRLTRAARLSAFLDALPDTGIYAPTAAQQAQIDAIRADLAAIVAKLKALLANEPPVVTPTTVKPIDDKVLGGWWWGHDCDGRHDGDRWRSWDGWQSWDGWRH
jgi:hypothetical protein